MKVTPDIPSQQSALFRQLLGAARERLSSKVGNYMVFGTQLVASQRVESVAVQGVQLEGHGA